MTVFEVVRQEVTAEAAAKLYGLKIDHAGRGFCPFHDDGRHAAVQFFEDGGFYCHSCHAHGDATALTAQVLGLRPKEAAERLRADFHLNQPISSRPDPSTKARAAARRNEREALNRRWAFLCEVVRQADAKLARFTPETADGEFDRLLAARCKANLELDAIWEDIHYVGA